MLAGANTIWADGGVVTLTYAATSGQLDEEQSLLLSALSKGLVEPGTAKLTEGQLAQVRLALKDELALNPIKKV